MALCDSVSDSVRPPPKQMEQSPAIPWKFHVRMVSLVVLLGATDAFFVRYTLQHTMAHGVSVMIMFGFEVGAGGRAEEGGKGALLWPLTTTCMYVFVFVCTYVCMRARLCLYIRVCVYVSLSLSL
jgi:hypothetical protein